MSRLWEKGEDLNRLVFEFTVGDDPEVDQHLVRWDALGSIAHAEMLCSIGVITEEESHALVQSLREIVALSDRNEFAIRQDQEDCHTAIEAYLVDKLGDAGRRIHTGRSRNDQVLLAVRLALRHHMAGFVDAVLDSAQVFLKRAKSSARLLMPGHTHLQAAMPASVGMWLAAFSEALIAGARDGLWVIEALDSNPLGVGSGFGVPLALDRAQTTKRLGFAKQQRNPIAVQNSRGILEQKVLSWCVDIGSIVEKFACDMELYVTGEFGYFSLPAGLTTGSSIMPQKHNPDVVELLRARTAKLRGAASELAWVTAKLPSHYHRDFQYTKEPLFRGMRHLAEILPIVEEVVASFVIDEERIAQAFTADLFATYALYRKVRAGVPFRDAYRLTAEEIADGVQRTEELAGDFSLIGDSLVAEMSAADAEIIELQRDVNAWWERLTAVEKSLMGR